MSYREILNDFCNVCLSENSVLKYLMNIRLDAKKNVLVLYINYELRSL